MGKQTPQYFHVKLYLRKTAFTQNCIYAKAHLRKIVFTQNLTSY